MMGGMLEPGMTGQAIARLRSAWMSDIRARRKQTRGAQAGSPDAGPAATGLRDSDKSIDVGLISALRPIAADRNNFRQGGMLGQITLWERLPRGVAEDVQRHYADDVANFHNDQKCDDQKHRVHHRFAIDEGNDRDGAYGKRRKYGKGPDLDSCTGQKAHHACKQNTIRHHVTPYPVSVASIAALCLQEEALPRSHFITRGKE
jgi:hypothetical protein